MREPYCFLVAGGLNRQLRIPFLASLFVALATFALYYGGVMFAQLTPPFIISMLLALTIHEYAHGLVAYWLGDPTAKEEGRLTLNPIAHLDPLGTLMFLLIHFGWGKSVPINPRYFKHYKRDTALVSIAGPVSNLLIAFIAFGILVFVSHQTGGITLDTLLSTNSGVSNRGLAFLIETCSTSLFINLALMAFNLLPVAPLDGSKIAQAFVPLKYDDQFDWFMRNGPYILLGLIVAERLLGFDLLGTWISLIANPVLSVFGLVFGAQ